MKYRFFLLIFFLCPVFGLAQSTSATISGGVTDPSGRFILDADVEIANDATGVIYSAKTNSAGMYLVPILPPGHYHVQVSKTGFKTIIKADVILNVQSALALNFVLSVGASSESVTVSATSPLLNTIDASVSTVIDRKFVANIPLNGRSFQDLISMTPGVVTQSPQNTSQAIGVSGDFSVNGQRTESNYYTVDGVSANINAGNGYGTTQPANSGVIAGATALGTTQSMISVDALQEFRVQSSTYSAEYGRTPGGQFSLATRAGSNVFHGSGFDYVRNDVFDANNWFNDHYDEEKPALRQNDFGGTLGGRLMVPHLYDGRDRGFFFVSYEGLRLTLPQAATVQYVPDFNLRTTAPTALQGILNAFPVPTSGGTDYGSLAEFIHSYSLPSQIDALSIRIDYTFSPKLAAFFRFGNTPSLSRSRSLSSVTTQHLNAQSYTFGLTSQFSPSSANEFRVEYARGNSSVDGILDSFGGATPIDLATAMGVSGYTSPQPEFEMYIPGIGLSLIQTLSAKNEQRQWNIVDTASFSPGHHQLKFGIDFREIRSPFQTASPLAGAVFESAASVLKNSADILLLYKFANATPVFHEFATFAQDEWRINPRLNLSLGLRWEVNPPPTEAHGNDAYTLLGNIDNPSTLTLAPRGTPLWQTTYYNFAPRVGLAWQVHNTPGWETIVRTGGGVFFDTDNEFATRGFSGLGFSAENYVVSAPVPATSEQLAFSTLANAPYTSATVYAFPTHLQLPYTIQWNTSIQQALGKEQAVTFSYVASNGHRLLEEQLRSIHAFNQNFSSVAFLATGITSNYQSLQIQFQRSVAHGVQVITSYTWSHSLDYGSQAAEDTVQRGNSDFDVRNNFQAGLSWDLPRASESGLWARIRNGWGLDARVMARTGFPITLRGNYLTDPSTGRQYYTNVDLVPQKPVYLYGSKYPGGRAINPGAFHLPTGDDQGNAPRNFVRGFGATQLNLALRRDFPLYQDLHLQFRAEGFNLLNHPNFGYIDPTLADIKFGMATETLNSSLGTLAPQYQQGGPRSAQFALKLIF